MNTSYKIFKYIVYFLLSVMLFLIIMVNWPKGSYEEQMERRSVPALAYGIMEDGEFTTLKVIGELEKGVPAPINSIFNIASVTKPVFSVVALNLIQSGYLGLDEPVHPYWIDNDIKNDERHKLLTPRMLLSHQSGFPNWRWNREDGKLGFSFDPGNGFQYSGEGMEYLRHVLRSITGLPLNYLADSILFDPLEMNDSHFIWDQEVDEGRFAKWYDENGNKYDTQKRTDPCAADDLMTTVEDLGKFAQYIIDKKGGLSDAIFNEMVAPQVKFNQSRSFGLGWEVASGLENDEYALVHGGSDIGVRARLVILPESKRVFIGFTNGDKGQQLIDRVMAREFDPGRDVLSKIYAPIIWRIIYLPFKLM